MNAKQLIAAIAMFAAAGAACAQQSEFTAPDAGFQGNKTRAEVRVEMEQAYKQGWHTGGEGEWVELSNAPVTQVAEKPVKQVVVSQR
jgi:hypothetical protein